jgi:hypothetical protein
MTTFELLKDPLNTTMVHAVAYDSQTTSNPETSDMDPGDVHMAVEGGPNPKTSDTAPVDVHTPVEGGTNPKMSDTAPVDVHTLVEGDRLASNPNHRVNQSRQPAATWLHGAMDCARDYFRVPCLVGAEPNFQSSFVQSSCDADTGLHTASAEVAWEAHCFPSTTLALPSFHIDPKQCIVNGDRHSFLDSQGKGTIHDSDGNWDEEHPYSRNYSYVQEDNMDLEEGFPEIPHESFPEIPYESFPETPCVPHQLPGEDLAMRNLQE